MRIQHTATKGSVTFTVRATERHAYRDMQFRRLLGIDLGTEGLDDLLNISKMNYCSVAAHLTALSDEVAWQPPDMTATAEELAANYEAFLDEMPAWLVTAIVEAINSLYQPDAPDDQKPDAALTDAEAADPN